MHAQELKMKDVCMPVVKVSQGDFKVVYAREILC